MRSLKEMKKKAAAAAFLLLGAVGVVSYASEADTAKTPFVYRSILVRLVYFQEV